MISLIILIIIIGIGGYFMFDKKDTVVVTNDKDDEMISINNQTLPTVNNDNNDNNLKEKEKKEISFKEKNELNVVKLANFFVSMLGSYSTDANFKNIIDLKPMMTDKMKIWADDFIKRNLDNKNVVYITTKSFSNKIVNSNGNMITVLVKTRREIKSDNEQRIYNQDALVTAVKVGSNWLVDSVIWK